MKISPISINFNNKSAGVTFESKKHKAPVSTAEPMQDTFTKREDNYTKAYKALVRKACEEQRNNKNARISISDVQFLLDIKDYEKFKTIISTPVKLQRPRGFDNETNIFYYTDTEATYRLARRLKENNDRAVLKEILSSRDYSRNTVFHKLAKDNDLPKTIALKIHLSDKEFRRFMLAQNAYDETPYSIAQEQRNSIAKHFAPMFEEDC